MWGGNQGKQIGAPQKYFAIKCKAGGRALDVAKDGPSKGSLIIWDYWKGENQQFGFVSDGTDKYIVNRQGQYLTVENNSKENGARIIGAPFNGGPGQKFQLLPVKQGSSDYCIITHCGKALDCCEEGKSNGTAVIQFTHHGEKNQQWNLDDI